MALQSMTGFAHVEGTEGTLQWTWELRSVNGRSLDVRVRLPAGFNLGPYLTFGLAGYTPSYGGGVSIRYSLPIRGRPESPGP